MILATTAVCMLTACGGMGTGMGTSTNSGNGSGTGSVLGGIIGAITNGEGIGNAITSVLGFDKVTAKGLVGAWHYESARRTVFCPAVRIICARAIAFSSVM